MKVNPSQQQPQTQQPQNAKPARSVGGQTLTTEPAPVTGTRSFASVLDSATNADEGRPEAGPLKEPETENQQPAARSPEERKALKSDDSEIVSVAASVLQLSSPIEIQDLSAPPAPREILPAADLENIMITVRTEMVVGGQPQTIIELPRSILEGLRVRLSTDRTGRINAEFVARTEAVRAQVDARAGELVDMLRFRGLNLSALRTSVGTDLNGGNDSNRRNPSPAVEAPAATGTIAIGDAASGTDASRSESDSVDSFTYRA